MVASRLEIVFFVFLAAFYQLVINLKKPVEQLVIPLGMLQQLWPWDS